MSVRTLRIVLLFALIIILAAYGIISVVRACY